MEEYYDASGLKKLFFVNFAANFSAKDQIQRQKICRKLKLVCEQDFDASNAFQPLTEMKQLQKKEH